MQKPLENELTSKRLREVLHYSPDTGVFTWVEAKKGRRVSSVGSVNNHGRRVVCIDGYRYAASRLAWLYMTGSWPTNEIDHVDGNRLNDRISNLREATRSQNNMNKGAQRNSIIGVRGVGWHVLKNKWQVQVAGKHSYHDNLLDAVAESYRIRRELHGEFYHA